MPCGYRCPQGMFCQTGLRSSAPAAGGTQYRLLGDEREIQKRKPANFDKKFAGFFCLALPSVTGGRQFLSISVGEKSLYTLHHTTMALAHEFSHFVDQESRLRTVRKEHLVVCCLQTFLEDMLKRFSARLRARALGAGAEPANALRQVGAFPVLCPGALPDPEGRRLMSLSWPQKKKRHGKKRPQWVIYDWSRNKTGSKNRRRTLRLKRYRRSVNGRRRSRR